MQNMSAIGSHVMSMCVCVCVCVDGGYFIFIASSQGNNLDFSFHFSFWNELKCEYFINGASCTVLGACGIVCVWVYVGVPPWRFLLLVSLMSKLRSAFLGFSCLVSHPVERLFPPCVWTALTQNSFDNHYFTFVCLPISIYQYTHVHKLHISLGSCGLIQDFNGHGYLHLLTLRDPNTLKKYKHTCSWYMMTVTKLSLADISAKSKVDFQLINWELPIVTF